MAIARSVAFMPVCMVLALVALSQPAFAVNAAFGVFTEDQCESFIPFAATNYVASGACTFSALINTYYRIVVISDTQVTYSIGCDSACGTCASTTTGAPGTCIYSSTNGDKWITAHPLKETTITATLGTACNATSATTLQSGACVATPTGYARLMDIGNGQIWYSMDCMPNCLECQTIGVSGSGGACDDFGSDVHGSFHINASAALTVSMSVIGMAMALMSAFALLG
ncbi:hypothetical protein CAOG_00595 [Capsaspora owczarzaki ATCC 30864]|uniref:Uncharacterized protein n=1 Tax=Capsaspora owczarzaki (strain ATCC 30864) TaxID=595528 RepID=A0A0D2U1F7_CAPO3|nr:hypothetical protein CAOG_00595 [Capsaspora owczarzaki ATCC 30864]KJE89036.1 hypothetical protein CAOG_000595 [Capsaspora owczarzaki ATCC 30864]|eukprot:XP_004365466.1 hypothetical protein CAOG_00595 [Capsaspora owczarzaki ATCC 30864]